MKKNHFLSALLCAGIITLPIMAGCSKIEENPDNTDSSSSGSLSADYSSDTAVNTFEFDSSLYIYSQLSDKEREYYDIIRNAVYDFRPAAVFPEPVDQDTMRKVFISVYYQEEDLFWLDSIFYRPKEITDKLRLTYRFDRETTELMKQKIEAEADSIFSSFTDETSDYEKLTAFHDRLVLGCTFSKDTPYVNTIYGALCDGYAQCEGYAFTFDYLCRKAGIDCFTLSGMNSEGALHAWNIVRLDDMWYNVDCTWDDPILDPVDEQYIRYYYFLASDEDINNKTHFPDTIYFQYPVCTSSQNYYKREGYYAENADEGIELLSKAAADALASGRKDAAVRFSNERAYETAKSRLFDSKEIKQVFAYANNSASDIADMVTDKKFVRYCNDDELIIHISMIHLNNNGEPL